MPNAYEVQLKEREKIKRYVGCPKCGAKGGEPCKRTSRSWPFTATPDAYGVESKPIGGLHKERRAAWDTAHPLIQLADCAPDG